MLSSDVLEIGIGLALVFLFVSLIATAAREVLESVMKTRAMDLERGIREMLSDPSGSTITKALFDHPQVYSLFPGKYRPEALEPSGSDPDAKRQMPWSERKSLPSYIPAANFANALIDLVGRGAVQATPGSNIASQPLTIAGLRASVATLPNERLQRAVLSAIDLAGNDLDKVKANLETWFNSTMDRVTGWYKRRTQWILLAIGIVMAIALNVDAIHITKRLASDKSLREAVVKQADKVVSPAGSGQAGQQQPSNEQLLKLQSQGFEQLRGQLEQLGLPVGWKPVPQLQSCVTPEGAKIPGCDIDLSCGLAVQIAIGWLITALAVMLGAPFWFDILSKFMTVRSTIKPSEKKPDADGPPPPPAPPAGPTRTTRSRVAAAGPDAPPETAAPPEFEPHTWKDGREGGVI